MFLIEWNTNLFLFFFPPLQFCAALFVGNYAVVSLCSGEALVNEAFEHKPTQTPTCRY